MRWVHPSFSSSQLSGCSINQEQSWSCYWSSVLWCDLVLFSHSTLTPYLGVNTWTWTLLNCLTVLVLWSTLECRCVELVQLSCFVTRRRKSLVASLLMSFLSHLRVQGVLHQIFTVVIPILILLIFLWKFHCLSIYSIIIKTYILYMINFPLRTESQRDKTNMTASFNLFETVCSTRGG